MLLCTDTPNTFFSFSFFFSNVFGNLTVGCYFEYIFKTLMYIYFTYWLHRHPFWSWSNGADHFYICAHDIGSGIGEDLLKNSIALVNTADYEDQYFIPNKVSVVRDIQACDTSLFIALLRLKVCEQCFLLWMQDISLPPALSPELRSLSRDMAGAYITPSARNILAFYAGDVTRSVNYTF